MKVKLWSWAAVGLYCSLLLRDIFTLILVDEVSLALSTAAPRLIACYLIVLITVALWGWGWRDIAKDKWPYQAAVEWAGQILKSLPVWGKISLILFCLFLPPALVFYHPFKLGHFDLPLRLLIVGIATGISGLLLSEMYPEANRFTLYMVVGLTAVLIFTVGGYLTWAVDYPFSLNWSEGNRMWDFSTFYIPDKYPNKSGDFEIGYIDRSRGLIWGFPFLFGDVSIAAFRFWDVVVRTLPFFIFGAILFKPEKEKVLSIESLIGGVIGFVILNQGPVYAHLMVPLIAVAIGLRSRNLWLASFFMALGSFGVGIGRFHWAYSLGFMVGMYELLNLDELKLVPFSFKNFQRPILLMTVSFVFALFGKATNFLTSMFQSRNWLFLLAAIVILILLARSIDQLLAFIKTNRKMFIGSSIIVMIGLVIYVVQTDLLFGLSGGVFRQDFLFDRLLPNPTYAIGVLFGIILTSIPVGWLIIEIVKQRYWGINRLQKWIIVLPLGTLLVVGLIASLKIGGGSNLHNLDLYIVGILMVLLLALEKGRGYFETLSNPRKSVFALLLIIPVAFNLHYSSKLNIPSDEIVQSYLDAIQAYVSEGELEGEVLFMDQRQLITFDLIHVDHFVFDYEKKKVMDRAMGKSQDYFDAFYEDLKNHRFSMIIGEPLVARNVDTTRAWSEENFVWQDWVVDSILEYYRPLIKFSDIGVQILVPK